MESVDFIQKYRIQKLIKAVKGSPSGATPGSVTPSGGSANPSIGERNFPVGTIRNGRQKVSSQPSRWVDVSTGKSYDNHHQPTHEHHKHEDHNELKNIKEAAMSKLKDHIYSDDLKHAERKLDIFLQKRLESKNLMAYLRSLSSFHLAFL